MVRLAPIGRNRPRRRVSRWWGRAAALVVLAALSGGGYWLRRTGWRPFGAGLRPGVPHAVPGGARNGNAENPTPYAGAPERLVRDDGAYRLIAVIDGAEANKRFLANLQVVNAQRQALAGLRAKIAAPPAPSAAGAAKADLEAQAKEIETRLTANLEFMVKNYGYSAQCNYILVPLRANLLEKARDSAGKVVEDDNRATLVKVLGSTGEYDAFESLRAQQIEAQHKKESGGDDGGAADALAKRLSDEFGFRAGGGNYVLRIIKGALYSKVQ